LKRGGVRRGVSLKGKRGPRGDLILLATERRGEGRFGRVPGSYTYIWGRGALLQDLTHDSATLTGLRRTKWSGEGKMRPEDISFPAWKNVKYQYGHGKNVPSPTGGFFILRTAIFQRRASF
jgi:hypothetical protein